MGASVSMGRRGCFFSDQALMAVVGVEGVLVQTDLKSRVIWRFCGLLASSTSTFQRSVEVRDPTLLPSWSITTKTMSFSPLSRNTSIHIHNSQRCVRGGSIPLLAWLTLTT